MGSNLLSIGNFAFYYCINLPKISIPHSVINIGKAAFKYCRSLSHIDIGFNLRIIGEEAFCDCRHLTDIKIPYSVGIIDAKAFHGCPLSTIQCLPQTPPIGILTNNEYWDMFFNNDPNFKIYVQTDSLEKYKSSELWGQYAEHMIGHDFLKDGFIR